MFNPESIKTKLKSKCKPIIDTGFVLVAIEAF